MLGALSSLVEKVWLLTSEPLDDLAGLLVDHPKLEIVVLGRRGFQKATFAWLSKHGDDLDVVHDTMGCFAVYFQSRGPRGGRSNRLVSTLYTNNWGWFHRVRKRKMDFGWSYVGQRVLTLWRDRRICGNADRIFVLGPGHEADIMMAHSVPADRVSWIPSEVNTEFFSLREGPIESTRTVLFTGAICRNKGIDTLLEACRLLIERHVDFKLRLVGRMLYWERRWFERACEAADLGDRIEITGPLSKDEVLAEYQGATIFAFPSRFEGSPRSVREAVACGLPAVVTDIPGHRGIDPEGDFLHFVEGNDPERWADTLAKALGETQGQAEKRGRVGADHMRSSHAIEAVAARLLESYADVIANPARATTRP
jgi:glycosyltransferase involved in cell wall biosynthesis